MGRSDFPGRQWWSRHKRIWWLVLVVVVLSGGGGWYAWNSVSTSADNAAADSSAVIQTATVRRGDLRVSVTGSGTLVASTSVDLKFPVGGTVAELNVREGETVSKGQVLARLGNRETLEAQVASANLEVLEAQKTLKELQQGADVALAQAYQDWVQAKGDYEDALEVYQRTAYARCSEEMNKKYAAALERARENLSKKPYGSDEWIEAKNNYDTALANYTYCSAYTSDEKTKAQAALELAEVTMKKAELTYNTLKNASGIDPDELALAEARLKSAEAGLAQAKLNLEGATMTAPMDGTVTYIAAGEGTIVGTDTFITISDLNHLVVEVLVDEADINLFTAGSKAEVVFDALPESTFHGTLTTIEPELVTSQQVQMAKGLVELESEAADVLRSFPLGLSATVEVIHQEVSDALLVPVEALRDLGEGEYAVFVVGSDGKLRLREVKVGLVGEAFAEITDGLSEGEVVSTGLLSTSKS